MGVSLPALLSPSLCLCPRLNASGNGQAGSLLGLLLPCCPSVHCAQGRPAPQVSSGVLRSSRGTASPGVSGLLPADRPETDRGRPCTGEQPWRGQWGYAGPCGASVFCAGPGGWGSFCSVGLPSWTGPQELCRDRVHSRHPPPATPGFSGGDRRDSFGSGAEGQMWLPRGEWWLGAEPVCPSKPV